MKRIKKSSVFLAGIVTSLMLSSCASSQPSQMRPQASQMRNIAELATIEVFYRNVAKYQEKDAEGALFWKKDKHFWIEYSGIVKIGIDTSLLTIDVKDNKVTVEIPEAKILDKKVDAATLSKDSFIVDKNSAPIDAQDETRAFQEAQEKMVQAASADTVLLAHAQQRAQKLLEGYVNNIGKQMGKEYEIEWIYLRDNQPKSTDSTQPTP